MEPLGDHAHHRAPHAADIEIARFDVESSSLNACIDDLSARLDGAVASLNVRMDELGRDIRELRALVTDALKAAN